MARICLIDVSSCKSERGKNKGYERHSIVVRAKSDFVVECKTGNNEWDGMRGEERKKEQCP